MAEVDGNALPCCGIAYKGTAPTYFLVGTQEGDGALLQSLANPYFSVGLRESGNPGIVRYIYCFYPRCRKTLPFMAGI